MRHFFLVAVIVALGVFQYAIGGKQVHQPKEQRQNLLHMAKQHVDGGIEKGLPENRSKKPRHKVQDHEYDPRGTPLQNIGMRT